jgi:hypothetical protein
MCWFSSRKRGSLEPYHIAGTNRERNQNYASRGVRLAAGMDTRNFRSCCSRRNRGACFTRLRRKPRLQSRGAPHVCRCDYPTRVDFFSVLLARIIHDASAASADTRLRRAVSPFSPSTYCTSMPQDLTPPSARLASRLHAFVPRLGSGP